MTMDAPPTTQQAREEIETEDYGVSYIAWVCKRCNVIVTDPVAHEERH